ncbi:tereporin-Ca1-like [Palaemon carinicauda]|uniref:tereporin-Ca1-like n=1 Tax=Palaemon carinicauda TaxID=392227 RepID=UPI0035B622C7
MSVDANSPNDAASGFHYEVSQTKRDAVATALSTSSYGSLWALGLDREGTGISNHMVIQNGTDDSISLHKYFLNRGKARIPPEGVLPSGVEDHTFFHAAGSWAATGSSGILAYRLDEEVFLHILWDCPYNFDHFCNFIGLYLCDASENEPSAELFSRLEQYAPSDLCPKRYSRYDLVCCGPTYRTKSHNGEQPWGDKRPCEVAYGNYYVTMTMGDSHKAMSKVSILKTKAMPKFASS